jgi:hypothetical protein
MKIVSKFAPPTALTLILLVCALLAGCTAGTSGASNSNGNSSNPSDSTVSVSPSAASVRIGASQAFTATVNGTTNSAVSWQVNGVTGGSSATGTISAAGLYTAPAVLPVGNAVTVRAVSAGTSISGSSVVTLLNPAPLLSGLAPSTVSTGSFTITVTGSGFVNGAEVTFGGAPLATTFVSTTQLMASGNASASGSFPVSATNPNPGSATSGSLNLQVQSSGAGNPPPSCGAMTAVQDGSLNGFVPFPANSAWNADISSAALDTNSSAIVTFIGAGIAVHPDFGAGLYQGQSIGIPYLVVNSLQSPVTINFTAYGTESDPGPMPIPVTAPIEGYPTPSGDRHVLVLDNANCWLYELYNAAPNGTAWNADSAAVWDLTANQQRPYTWTSADAAGLPIFPGLLRYDEVAAGHINHALRFTLQSSRAAFVPPASHWAANSSNALAAPMGMRMRLKANFNVATFSAANQVILNALKKYGMIMADNGSSMYLSGAPDDRWDNNDLHNLGNVHASDFEVVQMNPVYTAANLPSGVAPVISSFAASSQLVSAGTPVTLSWSVSGASYLVVSPEIGAVRGSSVSVAPSQSTMYTLYATNAFGRTTATINISVH